jgi:hypothetical protein
MTSNFKLSYFKHCCDYCFPNLSTSKTLAIYKKIYLSNMNFPLFLALFVQLVAVISATTCDANKKESQCMSASSSNGKCSWCSSGAVGAACYEEADALSLPSSVFQCEFQKAVLRESSCDGLKESACMKSSSGTEKCSWCNSAAVGGTCFVESDAKALPSSVFQCEYQKAMLRESSCDGLKESACMKSSSGEEKCSWCNSAAVGGTCFVESDAKALPTSVFQCEYQKAAYSMRGYAK